MNQKENTRKIVDNIKTWGYEEGETEELLVILAKEEQIDCAEVIYDYDTGRGLITFKLHLTEYGKNLADKWQEENDYIKPEYDDSGIIYFDDTWGCSDILYDELKDVLE